MGRDQSLSFCSQNSINHSHFTSLFLSTPTTPLSPQFNNPPLPSSEILSSFSQKLQRLWAALGPQSNILPSCLHHLLNYTQWHSSGAIKMRCGSHRTEGEGVAPASEGCQSPGGTGPRPATSTEGSWEGLAPASMRLVSSSSESQLDSIRAPPSSKKQGATGKGEVVAWRRQKNASCCQVTWTSTPSCVVSQAWPEASLQFSLLQHNFLHSFDLLLGPSAPSLWLAMPTFTLPLLGVTCLPHLHTQLSWSVRRSKGLKRL